MKVLLDTNIIIHREAGKIKNQDIGTLFRWLDRGHYTKVVHILTVDEIRKNSNKEVVSTFNIKLQNYEEEYFRGIVCRSVCCIVCSICYSV